jgi:hypothetical protein
MKTESIQNHRVCQSPSEVSGAFCGKVVAALKKLKVRLLEKYERALPGRIQMIRQAIAEAEELAWATSFPHLLLPAYTEARVNARLAATESAFAEAA